MKMTKKKMMMMTRAKMVKKKENRVSLRSEAQALETYVNGDP